MDENTYKIYTNIKKIPPKKAALVLGTSKYIAKEKGQKAIGFAAKSIEGSESSKKMEERGRLAMVKAYLDLKVLNSKLKVLGKKIKVIYRD